METGNQNTQQNKPILTLKNSSKKVSNKTRTVINLLDSWIEKGDKQEQKDTWKYLKKEIRGQQEV